MFHIVNAKEIEDGKMTDVYFVRTMAILKAKKIDKWWPVQRTPSSSYSKEESCPRSAKSPSDTRICPQAASQI